MQHVRKLRPKGEENRSGLRNQAAAFLNLYSLLNIPRKIIDLKFLRTDESRGIFLPYPTDGPKGMLGKIGSPK